ncbi:MAG: hypothetical protein AAF745_00495 [Planctomycetota bacterium]
MPQEPRIDNVRKRISAVKLNSVRLNERTAINVATDIGHVGKKLCVIGLQRVRLIEQMLVENRSHYGAPVHAN